MVVIKRRKRTTLEQEVEARGRPRERFVPQKIEEKIEAPKDDTAAAPADARSTQSGKSGFVLNWKFKRDRSESVTKARESREMARILCLGSRTRSGSVTHMTSNRTASALSRRMKRCRSGSASMPRQRSESMLSLSQMRSMSKSRASSRQPTKKVKLSWNPEQFSGSTPLFRITQPDKNRTVHGLVEQPSRSTVRKIQNELDFGDGQVTQQEEDDRINRNLQWKQEQAEEKLEKRKTKLDRKTSWLNKNSADKQMQEDYLREKKERMAMEE